MSAAPARDLSVEPPAAPLSAPAFAYSAISQFQSNPSGPRPLVLVDVSQLRPYAGTLQQNPDFELVGSVVTQTARPVWHWICNHRVAGGRRDALRERSSIVPPGDLRVVAAKCQVAIVRTLANELERVLVHDPGRRTLEAAAAMSENATDP